MKYIVAMQRRMDKLLPPLWQFLSGAALGALIYGVFGVSQGDSISVLITEIAAGLAVGLVVVAGLRYLGRAR
ncbi:hypothetical protein ACOZDE_23940 [Streptomyces griseoincarnatus]